MYSYIAIGEMNPSRRRSNSQSNGSKKYKFLKDYKDLAKKGQVLQGTEIPATTVSPGSQSKIANQPAKIMFVSGGDAVFYVPKSEIGKTIKVVDAAIPPASTGGTTGSTTNGTQTTQSEGLFTTKNIVIGVAVLAILYFGYTKFIKKGKK